MNIICLNIWGGRAGREHLLPFFEKHKDSTDVFCLQEVWSGFYDDLEGLSAGGRTVNLSAIMTHALQEITEILTDHDVYFRPHYRENYGLCMFVRKNLNVVEEGELFVHKFKEYDPPTDEDVGRHARNIQFVTIAGRERDITVINFHGLWNGQGKGDSDERLSQSDKILGFVKGLENPHVLCGNFNLTPDTESLQKFEQGGLRNLVREYGVTSTRTSLYTKPERFADYAFVSEGVEVMDFTVMSEEVSDHAALRIDIA